MQEFIKVYQELVSWAERARELGWLSASDCDRLAQIERQDSRSLFSSKARRPLVIGLFGGTGVGKSSLLNRLAGSDIAEVGIQRPTSRCATLYLHQSIELANLPVGSPVDKTKTSYHNIASRHDVAWMDMPDIDSVERGNKELVFRWLPYIDWIVYVVSPERYRDDIGWRVLHQRARRHHWVFVINRWDEGRSDQFDAFETDLRHAGIQSPTILRTSCAPDIESDDFDQLEGTINRAIKEHGLAELQRIGMLARFEDLKQVRDTYAQRLGSKEKWEQLKQKLRSDTEAQLEKCKEHILTQSEMIACQYPGRSSWWRKSPTTESLPDPDLEGILWDRQTQNILGDIGDTALVSANEHNISGKTIVASIQNSLENCKARALDIVGASLRQALTKPGSPMQRMLHSFFGVLTFALPLIAAGWVIFHVIRGYQLGLQGEQAFLGLDFATHSLLLIFLAWFLPFLMARWLRPSLRASASRGLNDGIAEAIRTIKDDLSRALLATEKERDGLLTNLPALSAYFSPR